MIELLVMVALWCSTPNGSAYTNVFKTKEDVDKCREKVIACIPKGQGPHMIDLECVKKVKLND